MHNSLGGVTHQSGISEDTLLAARSKGGREGGKRERGREVRGKLACYMKWWQCVCSTFSHITCQVHHSHISHSHISHSHITCQVHHWVPDTGCFVKVLQHNMRRQLN